MHWIDEIDFFPEKTIKKCFLQFFKNDSRRIVEVDESGGVDEIREEMEHIAADHGTSFTPAVISTLLHPDEEDDVM